jgi:hypothetical protein
MAQRYIPPQQSRGGQIFDVVLLLFLVFIALFAPLWLKIAVPSRVDNLPQGVTYTVDEESGARTYTGATWENLNQNATMQQQWGKLGLDPNGAALMVTQPFEYTIDYIGVIITAIVILGYYVFVISMSDKEYREVIREKFE